jgi:hypothetical protein
MGRSMETKSWQGAVKKLGEGKATVVIATLRTKDRDGDVLLPGAFGDQIVPVVGAHDWKMPPIGKARVFEQGNEAIADISFNLDTTEGKNWYNAIRFDWENPPPKAQYSWGFQVPPTHTHRGKHENEDVRFLHASESGEPLPIAEVSPVLLAAGRNTRSLSVKAFEDLPEPETTTGEFDDLKAAGVQVQSLIFPKSKWESADAVRRWLSSHGYSTALDTTENSYRARQKNPGDFQRLRSFCINPSRTASNEECRVMAVGGPMKESRGVDEEQIEQPGADRLAEKDATDVEDWQKFAEDRRPPLPTMIKWLRLYRYHMPFLRDIRQRDHKEVSAETISEFKTLVEEMLEVCTQFNIKLLKAQLLPTIEEEELLRQKHHARYSELTVHVRERDELAYQQLQAQAEELERQARARSARMKEMMRQH